MGLSHREGDCVLAPLKSLVASPLKICPQMFLDCVVNACRRHPSTGHRKEVLKMMSRQEGHTNIRDRFKKGCGEAWKIVKEWSGCDNKTTHQIKDGGGWD